MTDLFVDDEDDASNPIEGDCIDLEDELVEDSEPEIDQAAYRDLDARKRLEHMLDERRLRDELDDFGDY